MVCHMYLEAYIPGVFPWLLILLMISTRQLQLPAWSLPHPHPELGFVSTSIQMVPQRLVGTPAISWSTCALADFPLQGNMQTSVESPAARAFSKFLWTLGSTAPQDWQALGMAKVNPAFLMQVQVEVEKSWLMSTPCAQREGSAKSRKRKICLIYIEQL